MKQFVLFMFLFISTLSTFGQFDDRLLYTDTEQGKIVYNVAGDSESTSANLYEIIRKITVFRVGPVGELSLLGNSNITVSIDGVLQTLPLNDVGSYLNAFAANEVEKVEINLFPTVSDQTITEGGIINIVTRKRFKDGLSVSLAAHGSTSTLIGTNAAFNLKYKKFFFNGNYDYSYQNFSDFKLTQSDFYNSVQDTKYDVRYDKNHRSFLNAGFDITRNDRLSVSLNVYRNPVEFRNNSIWDEGTSFRSVIFKGENLKQEYTQVAASYQHLWNNNGRMVLSYEFGEAPLFNKVHSRYTSSDNAVDMIAVSYKNRTKSHVARLDASIPFKDYHSLNFGGKYSWYEGDYSYFAVSTSSNWNNRSYQYNSDSYFWNSYLQYVFNVRHFNFQAGVKVQKPFDFTDWFDDDIRILPSASLNFISDKNSFSLGYTMQQALTPYLNEDVVVTCPQKMNKLYMNYDYTNSGFSLLTTLSYQFCKDGKDIYPVLFPGTSSYYEVMKSGYMKSKQTMLSAASSYRFSQVCSVNLSASVGYTDIRREHDEADINTNYYGFDGNIIAGTDLNLPAGYKLGVNGGYYFSGFDYSGRTYDNYFYRLNVSKGFFDNKLSLAAHIADFFKSEKKLKIKGDKLGSKMYVPGMEFGVSLVYRFNLDF